MDAEGAQINMETLATRCAYFVLLEEITARNYRNTNKTHMLPFLLAGMRTEYISIY